MLWHQREESRSCLLADRLRYQERLVKNVDDWKLLDKLTRQELVVKRRCRERFPGASRPNEAMPVPIVSPPHTYHAIVAITEPPITDQIRRPHAPGPGVMLVQLGFITAFVAAMTLQPTDDPEWIETRVLPRVDASAAIDVGRRTWKPLPENTLAGSTAGCFAGHRTHIPILKSHFFTSMHDVLISTSRQRYRSPPVANGWHLVCGEAK